MRLVKLLYYPDFIGGLSASAMFITISCGWMESKRPFIEFILFFLTGAIIGKTLLLLDDHNKKRSINKEDYKKKKKKLSDIAYVAFVVLGFMTVYMPSSIKFWTFSVIVGFEGFLTLVLISTEIKRKKRYRWEDLW